MATYPMSSPAPEYPVRIAPVYRTLVSEMDAGTEQRRSKWLFPRYDVFVGYNVLTATEMDTLWAFFVARKGRYGSFYVVDPEQMDHAGLYVGTGDASQVTWDLPGVDTGTVKIYLDGTLKTVTTHYTLSEGGGEASADRVTFVSAPAAGAVITCDFTGFLRCHVRFDLDRLERELFSVSLFRLGGVQLRGVGPV